MSRAGDAVIESVTKEDCEMVRQGKCPDGFLRKAMHGIELAARDRSLARIMVLTHMIVVYYNNVRADKSAGSLKRKIQLFYEIENDIDNMKDLASDLGVVTTSDVKPPKGDKKRKLRKSTSK